MNQCFSFQVQAAKEELQKDKKRFEQEVDSMSGLMRSRAKVCDYCHCVLAMQLLDRIASLQAITYESTSHDSAVYA